MPSIGIVRVLLVLLIPTTVYVQDLNNDLLAEAEEGNTNAVQSLLVAGADVNAENNNGETALMVAAARGHIDTVRVLVNAGAEVSAKDNIGRTALMRAALEGHTDIVQLLKKEGAYTEPDAGPQPIRMPKPTYPVEAIRKKLFGEVVLKAVIDVHGKVKILEVFRSIPELDQEAIQLVENQWQFRPAIKSGQPVPSVAELVIAFHLEGSLNELLLIAAKGGNTTKVKTLMDKGAEVNAKRWDGATPLILAAFEGHADIVRALLSKGAKVNAETANDLTALVVAAHSGHADVVHDLLGTGAKINARSQDGTTALMESSRHGYTDVVESLLKAGAKVNAKNRMGGTALSFAARNGHTEIVRMLLDRGAKVNAKTKSGETAVTMAKRNRQTDIVELLSKAGATISVSTTTAKASITSAKPGQEIVRVGVNIKAPRKIKDVPPVYPDIAMWVGAHGSVILEANIDTDGKISNLRVLRSVPLLDQSAIDAVLQWRYEPTLRNGQPVPIVMTVTVNFALQ